MRSVRDLQPHCQSNSLAPLSILRLALPGFASFGDCVRVLAVVSSAVEVAIDFAISPEVVEFGWLDDIEGEYF